MTAIAALLGVTLVVFCITHIMGDPTYLLLGNGASHTQYVEVRHNLGYDRPIWTQYVKYLGQLVHGNLGISQYTAQPVTTEILQRFPATAELAISAMLLSLLWSIPLAIVAAIRQGGIVDRVSQALVEFGVAVPSFWLGLIFIYLFFYRLHIAPAPVGQLGIGQLPPHRVTGFIVLDALLAAQWSTFGSALSHLVLPVLTLSITTCPPVLQLTRNSMINLLRSDFIRSARSQGLPQSTIRRYAFRNALLPVVTQAVMTFGYLLGGTVLVETVFSWPGLGLYAVQSMQNSDFAPVLGVTLLASAVYVFVYALADVLAFVIDPRLREAT